MAEADLDSSCLLNKKIRNAQLAQYNFILGKHSHYWISSSSIPSSSPYTSKFGGAEGGSQ